MNLLVDLPNALFYISVIFAVPVFVWAVYSARWRKLMAVSERQHLWYGAIIGLGLSWAFMGVSVLGIFRLHPMLVTILTLMFGFRLAAIAGAAALFVSWLCGVGTLQTLPFTWLVSVLLPAAVTTCLLYWVSRTRIQNLFLYTLGVGFVGGLLTPVVIALSSLAFFWVFQPFYLPLYSDNIYLLFLFVFPEGFLNGMMTSAFAVMTPHLLKTYDDDFYLK
ncbi:hypothetical protein [Teredinibacter turnerae]|uniref:hypothetical protein n=1 Tax=Teredinibacter turnerae TaxID=2426 RepID=UPI0003FA78B0|nr:hypothetical protein [Teredinibacter turnerae]